ncbi:Gfo/Idh/MocA family protein [Paenibacillus eucommiae]|uniref:Dehydrogenase n=1 Tax=Paenibacillus eucommiae TaxID=1355755 RepID=A0ABS4J404_9BACL|nr:Gfo/Idh/MocA family oxidoreductase [Paenibacillus eucommiae]MBP1994569.1 putative dehydrogenase [Paenibacillus eucommiae]
MKTYVLVGAGSRAKSMFARPLLTELKHAAKLCGLYDKNVIRSNLIREEFGGIPIYTDFSKMLQEVQPDTVIVASTDYTHHTYIIEALQAGCDVISEKPLTIDGEKCKAIMEAERKSGKTVTVTFNLRFVPYMMRIKELLQEGAVGQVYHVDMEWFLDRSHGADYFRRWHGQLEYSGGLLVHKSTHHFDLINWWIESHPQEIFAHGSRNFYGPTREERGERCLTCSYKSTCEFYFDIEQREFNKKAYLEAEKEDGYIRDQCVFGDRINIYDTMSVNVKYESGVFLTYSLAAYSPYEGWRVTINGSKGRLEAQEVQSGPLAGEEVNAIRIFSSHGEVKTHSISKAAGGHGGGDERLRSMLFVEGAEDPLGQQAGSMAGAMSLIIGDAANRSIQGGQPVSVSGLLD